MSKNDYPIENYLKLGAAVVETAANDYLDAKKFLHVTYHRKKAQAEKRLKNAKTDAEERLAKAAKSRNETKKLECIRQIEECEEFFLSERFDLFMPSISGRDFLDKLKRYAAQGGIKHKGKMAVNR